MMTSMTAAERRPLMERRTRQSKDQVDRQQRANWPYCIQRLSDGRFVVLNRNYKPLGHHGRYFDYELYGQNIRIDEDTAEALSFNGSRDATRIYLFNDQTSPLDRPPKSVLAAYRKRVDLLLKLTGHEA